MKDVLKSIGIAILGTIIVDSLRKANQEALKDNKVKEAIKSEPTRVDVNNWSGGGMLQNDVILQAAKK